MVKLGEVANVFNGHTPAKKDKREEGHPVLKVKDIDSIGRFRGGFDSFVESKFAQKYDRKLALPGDIIILNAAHQSTHVASKLAMLGEETEGALLTGEWLTIRAREEVEPAYLYFWLLLPEVRSRLRDIVKGIHLYPKDVAAITFPLPGMKEQRSIVDILQRARGIQLRRQEIEDQFEELEQMAFFRLFSHEPVQGTVQDIANQSRASIRTGPFGSQLKHAEFVDSGIAVLGLDNVVGNVFRWRERRYITPGKYEQLSRYTVHPGDVLISIMGTVGRCVVVPEKIPTAINTKHICAITVDREKVHPEFVRAAFLWHPESRKHLLRQTKGSIMSGLNMTIIKTMPVPIPPMEKQLEFVALLGKIASQLDQVNAVLAQDEEFFLSLQSRAFRGEL